MLRRIWIPLIAMAALAACTEDQLYEIDCDKIVCHQQDDSTATAYMDRHGAVELACEYPCVHYNGEHNQDVEVRFRRGKEGCWEVYEKKSSHRNSCE